MSAQPSERAMRIASAYIQHLDACDEQYQTTSACVCAYDREKNDLASEIDSAIREAVEAMRERCCRAVTRLYKNDDGYGGSTHDRTVHRCELAIRALPLEEAKEADRG